MHVVHRGRDRGRGGEMVSVMRCDMSGVIRSVRVRVIGN
jgi:ribosomal protein L24